MPERQQLSRVRVKEDVVRLPEVSLLAAGHQEDQRAHLIGREEGAFKSRMGRSLLRGPDHLLEISPMTG